MNSNLVRGISYGAVRVLCQTGVEGDCSGETGQAVSMVRYLNSKRLEQEVWS